MSTVLRYNGKATRAAIVSGCEPKWITRHPRAVYVRQAYLAVPPWMDRAELRWLDWCRRAWSKATGLEIELDHHVPLNHKRVCGLTVPWNLRLMPRSCNAIKGGAWTEHHNELF
jgi:hypothetical protein